MEKYQQTACGGVGLMVSRTAAEVKKWNGRILVDNFSGNPALTIIVHYSPFEGSLEADNYYDHLTAAVSETPKHNMLIVMGDFNAHLDQSVAIVRYSYHNTCNSKGRLVKNFFEEINLFCCKWKVPEEGWEALDIGVGYECYENTGRLHHGQQKMEELCTRFSIAYFTQQC